MKIAKKPKQKRITIDESKAITRKSINTGLLIMMVATKDVLSQDCKPVAEGGKRKANCHTPEYCPEWYAWEQNYKSEKDIYYKSKLADKENSLLASRSKKRR